MQKLQRLQRAGTVTSWQHQCFEWQSDAAMQANSDMGCILPTQPCLHCARMLSLAGTLCMKNWLMCACFDMNHDVQVIGLRTGRVLSHTMAQSRTSNTLLQQHTGEVRNMTAATAAMLWHATQPLARGANAAEGAAALLCHVLSYAQYNCLGTQCEPPTHITRAWVHMCIHAAGMYCW